MAGDGLAGEFHQVADGYFCAVEPDHAAVACEHLEGRPDRGHEVVRAVQAHALKGVEPLMHDPVEFRVDLVIEGVAGVAQRAAHEHDGAAQRCLDMRDRAGPPSPSGSATTL